MCSKLKAYCDKATNEIKTIIVIRKDEKNVVIIRIDCQGVFKALVFLHQMTQISYNKS
jgi:hypothetical protein